MKLVHRLVLTGIVLGCWTFGVACSGGDETNSPPDAQTLSLNSVSVTSASELPKCTAGTAGSVAYVASESAIYACVANQWQKVSLGAGPEGKAGAPGLPGTPGPMGIAGEKGATGATGATGEKGATGATGAAGAASLVKSTAEPAGAHCATGGTLVETGIDTNKNGTLDVAEVKSKFYICNGTPGSPGTDSLIKVTSEPAGKNCAFGGLLIQTGQDVNRDAQLQATEVRASSYVCGATAMDAGVDSGKPADAAVDSGKPADAAVDSGKPADAGVDSGKPADAAVDSAK